MEAPTLRSYLAWLLRQSTERWGGRVDVYVAVATYLVIILAAIISLLVGGNDKIDFAAQVVLLLLAVIGIAALLIDVTIRSPFQLWKRLHARLNGEIQQLTLFMREGRELKDEIRASFDVWMPEFEDRAKSWEGTVAEWLTANRPEDVEPFLVDIPSSPQAWQPGANVNVATWGNTLDRRIAALASMVRSISEERSTLLRS